MGMVQLVDAASSWLRLRPHLDGKLTATEVKGLRSTTLDQAMTFLVDVMVRGGCTAMGLYPIYRAFLFTTKTVDHKRYIAI